MNTVFPVRLSDRSYEIVIGAGVRNELAERLRKLGAGSAAFVVTDDQVGPVYVESLASGLQQRGFRVHVEQLPAGEQTKTLRYASQLYDRLVSLKADRATTVVALGGGVVGDLAGFVAATFARGLRFVQVPTTLLAMVDASVGGKVAVDHPRAKNMIGAFHQPGLVLCDLDCLASLPQREYRCGMAEVVKYGVILDGEFFDYLEGHIDSAAAGEPQTVRTMVARSCELKADVVEKDERETSGLRAFLNYGHTFAHSFETAGGYSQLKHGEAVAIGMVCASRLAELLGMIDRESTERQIRVLTKLGLPVRVPSHLLRHDLVQLMRSDKKAVGASIRFVLPERIGQVVVKDGVPDELVRQVLNECAE